VELIKLKEISAPSATLPKLPSFSKMIDNSEMNKEMPKNMNFKQKNQDVYVQIDRFYSAKRALSSIRSKVEEIDSTLNKIRETRIHEEQTLSSWEKEVMSLKNKISEINDSLFQKIE
jgi:predicted nuclease with TOPRIM domain